MKIKLVCFDLDGTLIRGIHSCMFPCILNGKEDGHAPIQVREESGELDYQAADTLRAQLFKGLEERLLTPSFLDIMKPLENIESTINKLHDENILSIVITVGPKQVARAARDVWGMDSSYGSDYEVADGVFTGRILSFVDPDSKVDCLVDFCREYGIEPGECAAVGDGFSDIPLFIHCGKSIAINGSTEAHRIADHGIFTDDLSDILQFII